MKNTQYLLATITLIFGFFISSVHADEINRLSDKKYYATSFGGGLNFGDKRKLADAFYYGSGLGYQISEKWSVEAGIVGFSTKFDGANKTVDQSDCNSTGNSLKSIKNNSFDKGSNLQVCKVVQMCLPQPDVCRDEPVTAFRGQDGVRQVCLPQADICFDEQVCESVDNNPGDLDVNEDNGSGSVGECDNASATTENNIDVDGIQYYTSLFYHLDPINQFYPFVKTSVRYQKLDYRNSDMGRQSETLVDVGVGVQRFLTDNLSAQVTVSAARSVDNDVTDLMVGAGLSYYFGSKKPVYVASTATALPQIRNIRVELDVKFAFDKTVVRPAYYHDIDVLAKAMQRYPQTTVNLEGHTDWMGTDEYNVDLAQRRADAIRDVLITRHGIDASRVTTTSYGESQPVAENQSDAGRAKNRRTVAVITVSEEVPMNVASQGY